MILGTVFCSWICPFGLLSEWLYHLSQKVRPRVPGRTSRQRRGVPIKAVLLGLGLIVLNFFTDTLIFNQLSLPGWYSRIFQIYFNRAQVSWAAGFLAGVLLVEFVAQNRLWCRYICPQTLMIGAARLLNPWHQKSFIPGRIVICSKGENPCRRSCHLISIPRLYRIRMTWNAPIVRMCGNM